MGLCVSAVELVYFLMAFVFMICNSSPVEETHDDATAEVERTSGREVG